MILPWYDDNEIAMRLPYQPYQIFWEHILRHFQLKQGLLVSPWSPGVDKIHTLREHDPVGGATRTSL